MQITETLAAEFKLNVTHVKNVIELVDEGNTIPFIARYRKEMHGSMDDQLLREVTERLSYLRNLEQRKSEVTSLLETAEKLTDELKQALFAASTLTEVEDIYRPYKPKRRTRGMIAREAGLEPLAAYILSQKPEAISLEEKAAQFINGEKGIDSPSTALEKARDIIAEDISDNAKVRRHLRTFLTGMGKIKVSALTDEESVYSDYYDFSESLRKMATHRILAVNRGEKEGLLKVSLEADKPGALKLIGMDYIKSEGELAEQITLAARDSYERLLFPSLERELRAEMTQRANEAAIRTFGINLKALLMQPPVKNTVTLGFDPAYRTGCKLAVVDGTGKLLDTAVIYPTPPKNQKELSAEMMRKLISLYNVKLIAIGNGTASRESELFVAELIKGTDINYMIVSEAGASVYSASKLAKEEFPEFDVSLRSAVSIARRTQDPLAERGKIDPKSIGGGQYQHDMPPKMLDESLSGVVEDCVNSVGADLNTASASLLSRIAGVNGTVAKNIVSYRSANGVFRSREDLKKVEKLGNKTFEQCAGFLRVPESDNILDATGVHPESYLVALKLLKLCGYTEIDVREGKLGELSKKVKAMGEQKAAEICGVGVPTLTDIVRELMKPGRDPRDELASPLLRHDVLSIEDLSEGMILTGTVRNVVDFGAFVDIGVHQDGLVHISAITDKYIKHPTDVLSAGDVVQVKVKGVDIKKNRISLSMKDLN